VTNSGGPATGRDVHVNFDAPAILRKWPSLNNQRRTEGNGPYLLLDGTLDECILGVTRRSAGGLAGRSSGFSSDRAFRALDVKVEQLA
jgi:hypothetical protein